MQAHALCDFAFKKQVSLGTYKPSAAWIQLSLAFARPLHFVGAQPVSIVTLCHQTQMTEQERPANEEEKKSRQAFLCSSCSASGFCTKTTTTGANFRVDLPVSIIYNRWAAEYMTETMTKTSAINQRENDWVYFLVCSDVGKECRMKLNRHRMQELVSFVRSAGFDWVVALWATPLFSVISKYLYL